MNDVLKHEENPRFAGVELDRCVRRGDTATSALYGAASSHVALAQRGRRAPAFRSPAGRTGLPQSPRVGRLRSDRPDDPTSDCRRCQRPAPPFNSPASLVLEPILEGGEVVGVICPNCLTLREQRSIRAEQARNVRRLKRGLPLPRRSS